MKLCCISVLYGSKLNILGGLIIVCTKQDIRFDSGNFWWALFAIFWHFRDQCVTKTIISCSPNPKPKEKTEIIALYVHTSHVYMSHVIMYKISNKLQTKEEKKQTRFAVRQIFYPDKWHFSSCPSCLRCIKPFKSPQDKCSTWNQARTPAFFFLEGGSYSVPKERKQERC